MKKHLPNFITCLNLFTGTVGCMSVLNGNTEKAIYFVIICGALDFLDGLAARVLQVRSAIGKELDSLADVISFGLLPAFLMFRLLQGAAPPHVYLPYAGLLIVVFSALRLAKFNIDDSQSDKFIGLPTPANAIMLSAIPFLPVGLTPGLWGLLSLTLISSFLLVSPITMIALKFKGLSWSENALKYILLIFIALILAVFQLEGLPFVIPAYILVSIIGNFVWQDGV